MRQPSSIYSQKAAGFSLVELMIGLIIISILAGFLMWGTSSFMRTTRLRSAVREVIGFFDYARLRAATLRRTYVVQVVARSENHAIFTPLNSGETQSVRGAVFLQQGMASNVSQAFSFFNGAISMQGAEQKSMEMSRVFSDIVISSATYTPGTKTTPIKLFFRPDGRVEHCSSVNGNVVCTAVLFRICVRVNPDMQLGGPDGIPRRIEVQNNGSITVNTDQANLCP